MEIDGVKPLIIGGEKTQGVHHEKFLLIHKKNSGNTQKAMAILRLITILLFYYGMEK